MRVPGPHTSRPHDLMCKAHRRHVLGVPVDVVSLDFRNKKCDHKLLAHRRTLSFDNSVARVQSTCDPTVACAELRLCAGQRDQRLRRRRVVECMTLRRSLQLQWCRTFPPPRRLPSRCRHTHPSTSAQRAWSRPTRPREPPVDTALLA